MIAILLFTCGLARADVVDSIGKANEAVQSAGGQPGCATCTGTPYLVGAPLQLSKMAECILSMCKPDGSMYSDVKFRAELVASRDMPEYDAKFVPLVDKVLRAELKEANRVDRMMLDFVKRAPRIENPGAIRMFNLNEAKRQTGRLVFKDGPGGRSVVDEKASRPLLAELSDGQFKATVTAVNRAAKFNDDYPFPITDPGDLRLDLSEEQIQSKIKASIALVAANKVAIETDPRLAILNQNPQFLEIFDAESLRKSFPNGEYDTSSLENLNQTVAASILIRDSASDPKFRKSLESAPIDVTKFAKANGLAEKLEARIAERERFLSLDGTISDKACRYGWALAREIYPKGERLAQARPAIDALKAQFIEKNAELVCAADRKGFKQRASKWTPLFAPSVEEYDRHFARSLNDMEVSQRNAQRQNDQLRASGNLDAVLLSTLTGNLAQGETSDVTERCQKLFPNYLPDASAPGRDRFTVGPAVVANVERQGGVSFHELGHKMKAEIEAGFAKCPGQKKWFHDVRECLRTNHVELNKDEQKRDERLAAAGKPSYYESEDWADLISSRNESKSNNFACLMVQTLKPGLVDETPLHAPPGDPHSSTLYRLLHLEYLKRGAIPEVCREALAARGEKVNFKNCLQVPARTADGAQ